MNEPGKCQCCNGSTIAEGTLNATGRVSFRPDDAKFFKLKTANVDVQARLCLDCGALWLQADVDKVKALTDKS